MGPGQDGERHHVPAFVFRQFGIHFQARQRVAGKIAVRQKNTFGIAGGSRRVDEFGDVVRFWDLCGDGLGGAFLFQRGHGIIAFGVDHKNMLQRGNILREVLYFLIDFRFGNKQDFNPAVGNDVFPDLHQFRFVHGDKAGDASPGGESHNGPFHAVVGDNADDIPLADVQLGQSRPKVMDAGAHLPVRDPFINAAFVFCAEKSSLGKFCFALLPPVNQVVRLIQCKRVHKRSPSSLLSRGVFPSLEIIEKMPAASFRGWSKSFSRKKQAKPLI